MNPQQARRAALQSLGALNRSRRSAAKCAAQT
jgi:hypothetical protein